MAPLSEIVVTADMLRRARLTEAMPFCLRDVCGLAATALLGAGLVSWAFVLTSLSLGS